MSATQLCSYAHGNVQNTGHSDGHACETTQNTGPAKNQVTTIQGTFT